MSARQNRFIYKPSSWIGIAIVLLFIFPSATYANPFRVTLITSGNSDTYTTTVKHIEATIRDENHRSIKIRTITIEDMYSEKNSLPITTDLFVTIGQRALKETIKYSGTVPILASLVSDYGFRNSIKSINRPKVDLNIGAILIDQPLTRHLLFSQLVLPNSSRPGFIISSNNKNTIDSLGSLLDNNVYHIGILNPGDNVISTLSRILVNADAIIALPDPIVFNLRTTRNILLSTYRKRIPVIGFSKSYAKAGALAAIYSTPEHIGKQTGEYISRIAKQFLSQNGSIFLTRTNAKYFSISINNRVARSLGLPTLNAASLEKELLRIEKGRYE